MKKAFLKEFRPYVPARPVEDVLKKFNIKEKNIIKVGSNESAYGPSPGVTKSIIRELKRIDVYSSGVPLELRRALANYCEAPVDNIVVDAGIEGMLDTLGKLLIEKGDECIISIPTFEMYEFTVRIYGGIPKFLQRNKDFSISVDALLSLINKKTKLIFLCSPNNPTGNVLKIEEIEGILRSTNAYVIVDESYIEFGGGSIIPFFGKYKNLIVLRTLLKAFGLAAHRVDYGILPKHLVGDFNRIRLPFTINNLGVSAALAALQDRDYLQKVIRNIKESREYLKNRIRFKTFPSDGNFILVNVAPYTAKHVTLFLEKRGIIVRDCSVFRGMGDHFIRITVGKPSQNRKIVQSLNGLLK